MYDACVLHLNKEGTSPQLLNDIEMIEFLDQVKQSDSDHHKKEEEKYGTDYKPQTKPFQPGDEGIFEFDGEEKKIIEDIFGECLDDLIEQDSRFGNFEEKNSISRLQ